MRRIAASTANRAFAAIPNHVGEGSTVAVLGVQRPAEIVNYRTMGATPVILAAGLAAGALAALALTLAASVRRRRRRDLSALLKTLGFTQGQLAGEPWPGRPQWPPSSGSRSASRSGSCSGVGFVGPVRPRYCLLFLEPTVPILPVVLIALGALVLANIAAAVPGRIAALHPGRRAAASPVGPLGRAPFDFPLDHRLFYPSFPAPTRGGRGRPAAVPSLPGGPMSCRLACPAGACSARAGPGPASRSC